MFDLPKLDRVLTAEVFEPWIGRPFVVATDPEPVSIQLLRVNRRLGPKFALRTPFSLIFRTPMDIFLVDGIYMIRCESCGPHEIFLSPVLSPPGERLYEAAFN
jgi:hypothetical protein